MFFILAFCRELVPLINCHLGVSVGRTLCLGFSGFRALGFHVFRIQGHLVLADPGAMHPKDLSIDLRYPKVLLPFDLTLNPNHSNPSQP